MVAYSFKAQFEAPIVAGTKRQTIRADRKRHARPGEALQLYVGMRTRSCRLIGVSTCLSVWPVAISVDGHWIDYQGLRLGTVAALDAFARRDGFECWSAMRAFWRGCPDPWSGFLVAWGPLGPARAA